MGEVGGVEGADVHFVGCLEGRGEEKGGGRENGGGKVCEGLCCCFSIVERWVGCIVERK